MQSASVFVGVMVLAIFAVAGFEVMTSAASSTQSSLGATLFSSSTSASSTSHSPTISSAQSQILHVNITAEQAQSCAATKVAESATYEQDQLLNATAGPEVNEANQTLGYNKDSGTTTIIVVSVSCPIAASGVVIAPNGTEMPMTVSLESDGTVRLNITLGPSLSGRYEIEPTVVDGPDTTLTMISVTEEFPTQSTVPP